MLPRAILLLSAMLVLARASVPGGSPTAEYRSSHFLLRAPRAATVDRVLRELENGYEQVRRAGLDLPATITAISYGSTAEFVGGGGGGAYQLALAREGTIHLQPTALLLRRADLSRAVRHELVHVSLMAAAARGLPRWLSEGLAMSVAGEKLPVAGNFKNLEELERALTRAGTYQEARRAYGSAERLTSALIAAVGRERVIGLARGVAAGKEFRGAFTALAGEAPEIWGRKRLRP